MSEHKIRYVGGRVKGWGWTCLCGASDGVNWAPYEDNFDRYWSAQNHLTHPNRPIREPMPVYEFRVLVWDYEDSGDISSYVSKRVDTMCQNLTDMTGLVTDSQLIGVQQTREW